MAFLEARMAEQLRARHQGMRQATEGLGDLDADPAWVFAGVLPERGPRPEVVVADNQVICDLQKGSTQPAVGAKPARAMWMNTALPRQATRGRAL